MCKQNFCFSLKQIRECCACETNTKSMNFTLNSQKSPPILIDSEQRWNIPNCTTFIYCCKLCMPCGTEVSFPADGSASEGGNWLRTRYFLSLWLQIWLHTPSQEYSGYSCIRAAKPHIRLTPSKKFVLAKNSSNSLKNFLVTGLR